MPISQAKESEKKSHVYRSGIIEKCQDKSSNIYDDRQISYYIPWQSANLHDKPQSLSVRTHEDTTLLPVKNKIHQDKKDKKHSKTGNNTDNRRMTGNVNIYICSETNSNNERDKQNMKSQPSTDTNSVTTIEQSHSRYNSTSSASLCKLINNIQEKRRKLQTSAVFPKKKDNTVSDSSVTGIVPDNRILQETYNMEPSEFGQEKTNTEVINEKIGCENTVSLTKDGCCKDISSSNINLQQDSLDSLVPRQCLNDNFNSPEFSTTICPAGNVTKSYDSDVSLQSTFCINMERENWHRQNSIWRNNNNENTVCDAVDNNSCLSRPIYTDSVTYGEMLETCPTADNCKYRDRRMQDFDYKRQQEFSGRYREEHMVRRQWSVCSCITEEEEDYSTNIDRVEKDTFLGSVCNDAKQLGEVVSVCRTLSRKLIENAAVYETMFDNVKERSVATQTYKSSFRNSKGVTLCRTTFENSKVAPKVTRVSNKFVVEESPRDITVCKTIFNDPKESLEEITVCETVLSDSKERPEETICKILNSNSVNQHAVERVSLRDKRDKFTTDRTDNSNLNNRKKNSKNSTVQSDNEYESVTSDAVKKQELPYYLKQNKKVEKNVNNENKFLPVSINPIKGSTSLLTDIPETLSDIKPDDQKNFTSISKPISDIKDVSKNFTGQRKITGIQLKPLLNQSNRNLQRSNELSKASVTIDFASNKSHEKEKVQKRLEKETEKDDKSKEIKMAENKKLPIHYKDSFLYRLFKKLTNIIRSSEGLQSNGIETEKSEFVKTITNDKKDIMKPTNASQTDVKINDKRDYQDVKRDSIKPTNASSAEVKKNDKKDYQNAEKIYTPAKTSAVNKDMIEDILHYARSQVTVPVDNIKIPEQNKRMDVSRMTQVTHLKPKLLRIIAAKRLHPQRTEKPVFAHEPIESIPMETAPVESIPVKTPPVESIPVETLPVESISLLPVESIPMEISPTESVEIKKIKQYDNQVEILPEFIYEEDTERMKAKGSVMPKIIENEVKDTFKMDIDERRMSEELKEKIIEHYVACTQKEAPKSISDKDREVSSVLVCDCSCIPIKYTKDDNVFIYCKKNGSLQRTPCICSRLSMTRYTCVPSVERDSKSCLRNENQVHGELTKNTRICKDYCKKECRCRKCIAQRKYSKTIGTCKPSANCINCCRPENKCCCTLVQCYKVQRRRSYRKMMICLYCDNPRDKCICRAPIRKCSHCGLSLDICNCENERIFNNSRKRFVRQPANVGTIRVTSWKPNKEIRRYFARDIENRQLKDVEECCRRRRRRRHGTKRQHPAEELPYQRLNVFTNVVNELQRKMSESAFCTRCRNNPCCCGSKVDQDERKEGREVKRYDRYPELRKTREKSPEKNCQFSSTFKNRYGDTLQATTSINRNSCVRKLLSCKCEKRLNGKRPLAKCYYCKSLPCNCIVTS